MLSFSLGYRSSQTIFPNDNDNWIDDFENIELLYENDSNSNDSEFANSMSTPDIYPESPGSVMSTHFKMHFIYLSFWVTEIHR